MARGPGWPVISAAEARAETDAETPVTVSELLAAGAGIRLGPASWAESSGRPPMAHNAGRCGIVSRRGIGGAM